MDDFRGGETILRTRMSSDTLNWTKNASDLTNNPNYSSIEVMSMGIFTMLCAVGLIMNILVISAFLRLKLYKSPSNLQLFSLAIDDCGTALLVEPLVITSYLKPKLFLENPWLCQLFSSTLHIFPWGSTILSLIHI